MSKTFFGRLLLIIGGVFTHLFQGAKKTYEDLPADQQAALQHGSGVIAIISQEVGKEPAEIRADIKAQFPDLDEASLENGLFTVAHAFNIEPKLNDIDDCISLLQTYLTTLTGNVWEGITHSLASLLAVIVAPPGTKFAAVGSLIEYVYETYFQKKN